MRFQRNVTLLLGRMVLCVVELDASAEVGGGAWSSPVRQRSGEHLVGKHPEAVSTHGEMEGRGEHLWLARCGPLQAGREHRSCRLTREST
jgi:hypothetical protein